ncbi:Acyltransferase family protein [Micromonospora echinaurantiaca]|uniref:Acyltransferase family protein n=1 Tax=Micromonospora echinaurantiaca TaxID=47857 RepID=A0A1C5HC68_9ACTN|nr:acyltransferase [Micromonospora echinaurantiaca]SCG43604.1 Acyltransferase family protein [Micromonospora echinaurantiaca]
MRRLRELAARTPADRERYVDLLRALAIILVVLGHWAVAAIAYDADGDPTGRSALPELPWAYPLTWVVQVMPVFFIVGGFANAASLTAHRQRGGDATGWLLGRSARLLRPTTALLVVLAAGALTARLVGAEAPLIRTVVWFATIPLWFLAAYLVVVPLTPVTYALHRRLGLAVPVALAALVAAGDLGRALGPAELALPNYLFGWLAVHQLGFAWQETRADTTGPRPAATTAGGATARTTGADRDGTTGADRAGTAATRGLRSRRLPTSRRAGVAMLLGGLTVAVLLTGPGPYPVSMINIPGEPLDNAAPPSVALLAVTTAQLGLILLLRTGADRWLRRSRPWQAVIAVNAVVLTVFLWHLSAVILLVGALDAAGVLPTPPPGSAAWLAWRLPWVLMLAVVLAVLIAVFGPIEGRTRRPAAARPPADGAPERADRRRATARTALTAAAFAAVVYGLVANSTAPKEAAEPLGVPVAALVAYLAGAGVLRLLRSGWGSRG